MSLRKVLGVYLGEEVRNSNLLHKMAYAYEVELKLKSCVILCQAKLQKIQIWLARLLVK